MRNAVPRAVVLTFLWGFEVHKSICLFFSVINIGVVAGEELLEFLVGHIGVEVTNVESV